MCGRRATKNSFALPYKILLEVPAVIGDHLKIGGIVSNLRPMYKTKQKW